MPSAAPATMDMNEVKDLVNLLLTALDREDLLIPNDVRNPVNIRERFAMIRQSIEYVLEDMEAQEDQDNTIPTLPAAEIAVMSPAESSLVQQGRHPRQLAIKRRRLAAGMTPRRAKRIADDLAKQSSR